MKTTQIELFTQDNEPSALWTHLEEVNPCRPIDPTGVGEHSLRSARLSSKKGQDLSMRQGGTGRAFRHELAQYEGSRD